MEQEPSQTFLGLQYQQDLIQLLLDFLIFLKDIENEMDIACRNLAIKIAYHAISIENMSSGISTNFTQFSGNKFVDFSSISILTRTVLESYLSLFEIFFEDIDSDEREYRYAVYCYGGYISLKCQLKEKLSTVNNDQENTEKITNWLKEFNQLEKRIKKTTHYKKNLDGNQKKATIEKAKIYPKRDLLQRAKVAGINYDKIDEFYHHNSGNVHSDFRSI